MNADDTFDQRRCYDYAGRLLDKFPDLTARLTHGIPTPDQVEFHLPPRGRRLCWLDCPHCFTHDGRDRTYRTLPQARLLALVEEIAQGHPLTRERPEKLILGGVHTDPLNSATAAPLVRLASERGFAVGVHTKGLRIDPAVSAALVARRSPGHYIAFSVDAGSDAVFNRAHGVGTAVPLYSRIQANIGNLTQARRGTGAGLRIVANYLITRHNACAKEIRAFAETMFGLGVDHLRFSLPIVPRMGHEVRGPFPQAPAPAVQQAAAAIRALQRESPAAVHFLHFPETGMRVLPCYARWLTPTVGHDGFLYPCCLTATEQFAGLRLVDLATSGFWDGYRASVPLDFARARCQCDRKGAAINAGIAGRLAAESAADRRAETA